MNIEDDPIYQELLAQDLAREQRRTALFYAPDCRDPDHPGCKRCEPIEEDEDVEAD